MVLTPDLEHLIEQQVEQRVQAQVIEWTELLAIRPITEAIAMRVETMDGFKHLEIVDGEWVGLGKEDRFMGGERHGRIEFKLLLRLGTHVEANHLGMLYPGDTIFVLDGEPGNIRLKRQPDVAFVTAARVQSSAGYIYGPPDLAIEIISPSERSSDIQKKLREYLRYGVKQVWNIYPEPGEVVVHLADGSAHTYVVGDTLNGGDMLPGLALAVADVFA